MSRNSHNEVHYLDLRARRPSETSFLGGFSLPTRNILFFLIGLIAIGAFAGLYFHTDQRLNLALSSLKDAQQVSLSIFDLSRSIDEIRVQDSHVRSDDDPAAPQIHRRAIDQVIMTLSTIQKNLGAGKLSDASGTIRDAFSGYGLEFAVMFDDRNILGSNQDMGLRGQRREAATNLRTVLGGMGQPELLADFAKIDARADQVPALASVQDRTATRGMYVDFIEKIDKTVEDLTLRTRLNELLQIHSAKLNAMLDVRARLETPPQAIDDILGYITPSLRELNDYGEQLSRISPDKYTREYEKVGKNLIAGTAIIIAVLLLCGMILIRSITVPVSRLSAAIERLVRGDRDIHIPLQGNADALGDISRALDKWLDTLAEIAHLRTELDDARMRLSLGAIAEGIESSQEHKTRDDHDEHDGEGDDEAGEAEIDPSDEDVKETESASQDETCADKQGLPPQPEPDLDPLLDMVQRSEQQVETIGTATRQLNQYNDYVSEAAREVERTEALINLLSDTTQQIDSLEACIVSIRDEANLLVFNAITPPDGPVQGAAPKPLPEDDKASKPGEQNTDKTTACNHNNDVRRFEALRAKVGKAEQVLDSVNQSLGKITSIAHDIARVASAEAIEATGKLLAQSGLLQSMLDDLVNKVGPLPAKSPDKS